MPDRLTKITYHHAHGRMTVERRDIAGHEFAIQHWAAASHGRPERFVDGESLSLDKAKALASALTELLKVAPA